MEEPEHTSNYEGEQSKAPIQEISWYAVPGVPENKSRSNTIRSKTDRSNTNRSNTKRSNINRSTKNRSDRNRISKHKTKVTKTHSQQMRKELQMRILVH